MMHILTVDLEDWFHLLGCAGTATPAQWAGFASRLERNAERLLELLAARQQPATFFCLGWVAERHPALLRRLAAAGHELGSHSYAHQLVDAQGPAAFREDLRRSLGVIEQTAGCKVTAYRAPGFSVTAANRPWVFAALAAAGIAVDSSVFPGRGSHGGIPDAPALPTVSGAVREFPVSVVTVAGLRRAGFGGGYFRLLPYALLRRWLRRAPYALAYFHPHDFDAARPVPPGLGPVRRWRARAGVAGAAAKLERLLTDFRFTTLGAAAAAWPPGA